MTGTRAETFPEDAVRRRAKDGALQAFPAADGYGSAVYGAAPEPPGADPLTRARLLPPVFTPHRLERLVDLGREPQYTDVDLTTEVGGFTAALPLYVSAFGSTAVAAPDAARALARQAGRLGIPMVVGENVVPVHGFREAGQNERRSVAAQIAEYAAAVEPGRGGIVVQQGTEDADAEVWNLLYSDPEVTEVIESGHLGFELKLGQGAKPGLGGMTVVGREDADRLGDRYLVEPAFGDAGEGRLRSGSPGTFTAEILTQQVHLMRNNFPRARTWVKLPPTRDVAEAARVAWAAGAHAVTVDGAEAGSGWAPYCLLDHVGLPLADCLTAIGSPDGALLASGRIWEGSRAVKCLALGARAVGLGRAALLAVDEDRDAGLIRLVECLALEMRLLISALGKYSAGVLGAEDVGLPDDGRYGS